MRGTEQVLVDTFTILNNSRKNFIRPNTKFAKMILDKPVLLMKRPNYHVWKKYIPSGTDLTKSLFKFEDNIFLKRLKPGITTANLLLSLLTNYDTYKHRDVTMIVTTGYYTTSRVRNKVMQVGSHDPQDFMTFLRNWMVVLQRPTNIKRRPTLGRDPGVGKHH